MNFGIVKETVDKFIARGLPEAQVIIHKDGKEVYRCIAGHSDEKGEVPARYDDIFQLYSMSKVYTVTAAMRLVERGLIDLDEPIDRFLPAFKNIKVKSGDGLEEPKNPLTLRRLMSMTGGLSYEFGDYPEMQRLRENGNASTVELVNAMASTPLHFQPGSDFRYSFCHDVVGALIEVVSGKSLGEYMQEELFEPLGIIDMGYHLSQEQLGRMAEKWHAVVNSDGRCEFKTGSKGNWLKLSDKYESGGAGLFGNAEQYIKMVDTLANGGIAPNGYRVLKPESIELMRSNQLDENALKTYRAQNWSKPDGFGYGLGVRTVMDTKAANISPNVHEFGWDGAAGSYVMIDPVNHITAVYVQHVLDHMYMSLKGHREFRNAVYSAFEL